jgi:Protein of unknown function (DUF3558)
MRTKMVAATAVALGIVLAACGGGDDNGSDARSSNSNATTTSSNVGDTTDAGGEVPDPCQLVPSQQLADLLGADPGTGTVNAVVPDERKVCNYGTGLILAVEVSRNYEASVDLIRENAEGATVQDVPGVGSAAIWQEFGGGLGQFVARGPDYFVGVTLPSGGIATGQAIAEAMLANV